MDALEALVLIRMLLEILMALPNLITDVEDAVAEIKASQDGEAALKAIAVGVSAVSGVVAGALGSPQAKPE